MAKIRLDTLLHRRGLFESRARAAASVMAGEVRLGDDGSRAAKPGQMVAEDVAVAVDERPRFVSRGGIKLANALAATGVDPAGRRCLDVGASTGGFTDCLLQRGAAHVVALDVAYGELDWRLRTDDRVTVIERDERARAAAGGPALRPGPRRGRRVVHLAGEGAAGGARLLRAALRRAGDGQAAVRGRPRARGQGRRRARRRRTAGRRSSRWPRPRARSAPSVLGFAPSGLPGPKGNHETFVWLAEGGRAGAVGDLDAAAARGGGRDRAGPHGHRRQPHAPGAGRRRRCAR